MSKKPLCKISGVPLSREEFKGPFDSLFDEVFDRAFGDFHGLQSLNTKRTYPKVDVYREDADLVFEAAVPGMKKEDLSIEFEDSILTIRGETQTKLEELPENPKMVLCSLYIKELKKSSFMRRFTLPSDLFIDSIEGAEAKLEDGILTIRFTDAYSKTEVETKVKDIPIK